MRFYFHEDAEAEFDRAVEYYDDFRPGLGLEFTQEVYAAITRFIQFPDAWSRFPIFEDAQITGGIGCKQNQIVRI